MVIRIFTIFLVLLEFPFTLFGQINEQEYLFDRNNHETFKIDSADEKIVVSKVMDGTYVISYLYYRKFDCTWCFRRYYDELRWDYWDTAYSIKRIYRKCCGSGNYVDTANRMTIYPKQKEGFYSIIIFDEAENKIIQGRSKYFFPLIWNDTLSFFSSDGIKNKQIIYDSGEKKKTIYWDKKGGEMTEIFDFKLLDVEPNFLNTEKTFIENLNEFLVYDYPQKAMDNDIDGDVYIYFIITKDGEVDNVEDLRRVPILSEYCINKVKSIPKLTPGTKKNVAVNTGFVFPFRFRLD